MVGNFENAYVDLICNIMGEGEERQTRAGKAYSIFGTSLKVNTQYGFPLLQGRKMFYKGVLGELAAMLKGPKNVEDFKKEGCNYWDAWGEQGTGNLNLDYGNAWINYNGENQLENVIKTLKENPQDRRMLISGWRPDRVASLSLPCCHLLYQWYVRTVGENKYLDMIWYQRSVDVMIGLPSDIVLAAAWNMLIANEVGLQSGIITMMLGDTHIYANHTEGVTQYLYQYRQLNELSNKPISYYINCEANVRNFNKDSLLIKDYTPQPAINFTLNV